MPGSIQSFLAEGAKGAKKILLVFLCVLCGFARNDFFQFHAGSDNIGRAHKKRRSHKERKGKRSCSSFTFFAAVREMIVIARCAFARSVCLGSNRPITEFAAEFPRSRSFPLAAGRVSGSETPISRIAARWKATPSQVALAWLLARSPVILPIPGTSRVEHLEENVAAAELKIDANKMQKLDRMARAS